MVSKRRYNASENTKCRDCLGEIYQQKIRKIRAPLIGNLGDTLEFEFVFDRDY